ncbi:MAG: hypothetical protein AB7Q45_14065, partial [Planctomycetaceae bacterium]
MLRIIGLLSCCGLAAATLWIANLTRAQEDFNEPNPFAAVPAETLAWAPAPAESNPFADEPQRPAVNQDSLAWAAPGEGDEVSRRRVDDFLRQARLSAREGDVEEALRLATTAERMAAQFNVSFKPGEQTPGQLIAELKHPQQKPEIAARDAAAAPQSDADQRAYVQLLLQSALDHLRKGNFEAARQKAEQADQVKLTYGQGELRPQMVLDEIKRLQPADAAGPSPAFVADWDNTSAAPAASEAPAAAPPAAPAKSAKEQAVELLALARQAIQKGYYDEARTYALEAKNLGVEFQLFDDTPDYVLAEIERKSNTKIITASPAAATPPAAADQAAQTREQAAALLAEAR